MIRLGAAAVAILLSVGLAGCTPPSPVVSPTPTDAAASPTPTPTPTPTPSPSDSVSADAPPAIPPSTTDDPCLREALDITFTPTDNSAGHAHGVITLTNISTATCSIQGYPTVWFDNPEAQQPMGDKATKEPFGSLVPQFDLVPGASAVSNLTITQAGLVDGCTVVQAVAFLIIPPLPGEVGEPELYWRHVPVAAIPACNEDAIGLLSVTTMLPAS